MCVGIAFLLLLLISGFLYFGNVFATWVELNSKNTVPVKIQAEYETIEDSIEKLERACMGKNYVMKIVIQTKESNTNRLFDFQSNVEIIKSLELQTTELTKKHNKTQKTILQKLG